MSDYYPGDHEYLDDRTFLIVNGFIHEAQYSILNHIPLEIIHITVLYIDDHFMLYRGAYEFVVDEEIIISAVNGSSINHQFESGKLQWLVKLYLNGRTALEIGKCMISLQLLSIPTSWKHITVRRSLKCETLKSFTNVTLVTDFKTDESFGWAPDLSLQDVKLIEKITFTISLKILRITMKSLDDEFSDGAVWFASPLNIYKKHHQLKWILNQQLLHQFNDWLSTTQIHSKIYGDMFCIGISPNSVLSLMLCSLPPKLHGLIINTIQVKCTLQIEELNIECCNVHLLSYKHWGMFFEIKLNDYTLEEFDSLTILMNVEILHEYDLDGNIVNDVAEIAWIEFNHQTLQLQAESVKRSSTPCLSMKDLDLEEFKDDSNVDYDMEIMDGVEKLLRQVKQIKEDLGIMKESCDDHNIVDPNKFTSWLKHDVELFEYYDILKQHGYDNLNAIKTITMSDLDEIGIYKKGHKKQLLISVKKLRDSTRYSTNYKYTIFEVVGVIFVLILGVVCGKLIV